MVPRWLGPALFLVKTHCIPPGLVAGKAGKAQASPRESLMGAKGSVWEA